MKARLIALTLAVLALALVLAISISSTSTSQVGTSTHQALPVAPYWNSLQMAGRTYDDVANMPVPAGAAILVAEGYLIASFNDMGTIARDIGADPTVGLYDGSTFVEGRYVDVDWASGIALIRADLKAAPISLRADGVKVASLAGILEQRANAKRVSLANAPALPCTEDEAQDALSSFSSRFENNVTHFSLCFTVPTDPLALNGMLALSAEGEVAGVLVRPAHNDPKFALGHTVADIRTYLDGYFASWGSGVTKPQY